MTINKPSLASRFGGAWRLLGRCLRGLLEATLLEATLLEAMLLEAMHTIS